MARKVYAEGFGGVEVLSLRTDEQIPVAGHGEVRVRVRAAGLNPVDYKIFAGGDRAQRFGVTPPFGNGNDYSGVIDQVGEGVSEWEVGDFVYGGARFAAQADYLIVHNLSTLNRLPAALDHSTAAVLDIAGRTAIGGLRALDVSSSDVLLLSGAAGGVGTFASQLAVRAGARVLGTASPANHAFLESLGVEPVEYGAKLEQRIRHVAPEGVTAVFDTQGRETIEVALRLGVEPRRINSVGDKERARKVGAISAGRATTSTAAVSEIADLAAAGDLVVPIEKYALENVAEAYREIISGHVRGKLVLTISG